MPLKSAVAKVFGMMNGLLISCQDGSIHAVRAISSRVNSLKFSFPPSKIKKLVCSRGEVIVLANDGELWRIGFASPPESIPIGPKKAVDIFGEYLAVFVVLEDGSWLCWGNNQRGQLGLGHEEEVNEPCDFAAGKKHHHIMV
eukprot:TRINITY_DN2379_c0_g1_i1.p2 TRINITY_DN2379_c0_g1~~TRINITY_DN2379_c0_g1_i1.p2  ORF type:complete len:142 (-),score=1.00 TRINITY_DN2379_c0_g1_i1:209-634(-)